MRRIRKAVIAVLGAGILAVVGYYFFGSAPNLISSPEGYQKTVILSEEGAELKHPEEDSGVLEAGLKTWLEAYMKQYETMLLPWQDQSTGITIMSVSLLPDERVSGDFIDASTDSELSLFFYDPKTNQYQMRVAQIDFWVYARNGSRMASCLNGTAGKNDTVQCQWVVYYQIDIEKDTGKEEIKVWKCMRPAAYDLAHSKEEETIEGTAATAEARSRVLEVETDTENWNNTPYADQMPVDRIHWVNGLAGFDIRLVDSASGQEEREVFRTVTSGTTWIDQGPAPLTVPLRSYCFIDSNTGFLCYQHTEGEESNLYRSTNGGKEFKPVPLPTVTVTTGDITLMPFVQSTPPWSEDGVLKMYLMQGEDGDYNGGTCAALLESMNRGLTWEYTGKIVEP